MPARAEVRTARNTVLSSAVSVPDVTRTTYQHGEEATRMRLPQLTAEACLYQGKRHYRTQDAATYGLRTEVEAAIIRFGNVSICSGDDDCNGMFLTGCTGSYARCWIRGPNDGSVFCMCSN